VRKAELKDSSAFAADNLDFPLETKSRFARFLTAAISGPGALGARRDGRPEVSAARSYPSCSLEDLAMRTYDITPLRRSALSVDAGLSRYLADIRKFPILTPEEELAYAKRWREHRDRDAAFQLVTSHLRLVAKIASAIAATAFRSPTSSPKATSA